MIADAIEFVRAEIRDHLGVADQTVIVGPVRRPVGEGNLPGAWLSLVNVQEETALRVDAGRDVEPAVRLNLFLLIAFEFPTYADSLVQLSRTLELFRRRPSFSAATQACPGANPFPTHLDQLVFEMVNMNFEDLNDLWGVLGCAHVPSVVCRVRMIGASDSADGAGREIDTVTL